MWFKTCDSKIVNEYGAMIMSETASATGRYAVEMYPTPWEEMSIQLFVGSESDCDCVMEDLWRAICAHKDHFDVMKGIREIQEKEVVSKMTEYGTGLKAE